MPLTDLSFAVTAKKLGPAAANLSRPKVFYLKSSDLMQLSADADAGAAVIKVNKNKQKIELYESPDDFLAAQALSQSATGAAVFTKSYQNLAPTSSATAADQSVASKYTTLPIFVYLPDCVE